MSSFIHVWFGDILVNGLAVAGVGLMAFLACEMVHELRKKRRRRMRDEAQRREPQS